MKYTFELAEQDLEFDEIDPHGLGLPATLYLLVDGERITFAREAIEYYCTPKDGGVIYHFAVKSAIRNGTFEEEYNVTFNMATDDEIIERFVSQSEVKLDLVAVRAALEEFTDTLTDEYAEFASLFGGADFWPLPEYTTEPQEP